MNSMKFNGIKGGGLRISKQILRGEYGREKLIEYNYFTGSLMGLPEYAVFKMKKSGFQNATSLAELETYLGIDTFMAPHSHVEFTNGSYVGYDRVVVIKGTGNIRVNINIQTHLILVLLRSSPILQVLRKSSTKKLEM
ncbi:hypothetical protein OQ279_14915 [Salinimicrobium sp. MT39]|uniref:Uncharacterized protein n=1 Tax=Salinimicrobium profundisediminis TaxID=2994553 RepID=A0A9X3CZ90_9FLAO|nr:hypothetical protein [Salinimicrobium profundisediminis]MCX2839440.1 hypothetical protein [Salinimicrobium profundisediminis]